MRFAACAIGCLFLSIGCDAGSSTPAVDPFAGAAPATGDDWVRPTDVTPVAAHGQLSVSGVDLVDEHGERVQLKGVSSMWLNWESKPFAENAAALTWMRDNWNLSVIRAAVGIDDNGNYYEQPAAAKAQLRMIVDNAVAAGVYVIVDYHGHRPNKQTQQAVDFFAEMSAAYADVPNVLWEPWNEPTNVSWTEVVKPYHQSVVDAIRASDPDNVIILGTPNWSQDVDVAAGAPLQGENIMYTLHFYSCTHGASFRSKGERARAKGAAIFVTEWGATDADGGTDGVVCRPEAAEWTSWMRQNSISWSSWKLDACERDSSCLLAPAAPVDGGWVTSWLHGHADVVRDALRE